MCQQVKQGKPSVTSGKTETPRPDCGAPQLKQRETKLAPKRKGETIHQGDAIQKKRGGGGNASEHNPQQQKKGWRQCMGTQSKKRGGDNSRADYSPQKKGEILKIYSGKTIPPGLFYVRPWVTSLETGWPFYLYTTVASVLLLLLLLTRNSSLQERHVPAVSVKMCQFSHNCVKRCKSAFQWCRLPLCFR